MPTSPSLPPVRHQLGGGPGDLRNVFAVLGGRWTCAVLEALSAGPLSYNRLLERVDGISSRMLTHTLRALEREGLIARRRPSVRSRHHHYALSDSGARILAAVHALGRWWPEASWAAVGNQPEASL